MWRTPKRMVKTAIDSATAKAVSPQTGGGSAAGAASEGAVSTSKLAATAFSCKAM